MMTFDEFMRKLRKAVDDFSESWVKNMEVHPGVYPDKFPSFADWWEQFDMFVEMGEDGR